jgi:hypothetical protein
VADHRVAEVEYGDWVDANERLALDQLTLARSDGRKLRPDVERALWAVAAGAAKLNDFELLARAGVLVGVDLEAAVRFHERRIGSENPELAAAFDLVGDHRQMADWYRRLAWQQRRRERSRSAVAATPTLTALFRRGPSRERRAARTARTTARRGSSSRSADDPPSEPVAALARGGRRVDRRPVC